MNVLEAIFWMLGTTFFTVGAILLFALAVIVITKIRKPLVRCLLVILYIPVLVITNSLAFLGKRV